MADNNHVSDIDSEKAAHKGSWSSGMDGAQRRKASKHEDPFAAEEDDSSGVQYRTLAWWQAAMIMIAETISLGILSLPSVVAEIGLVGAIILILGFGAIATYSGYVLGQMKSAYPFIHTFADAGEVLFAPIGWGAFGKEFFGAAQTIFLIFTMGSHLLTWTIMLNVLSDHGTCSIVFGIVGLVVFFLLDLPRTMKNLSYWCFASAISILAAVVIVMIDVGVVRPGSGTAATNHTEFASAFVSVTNIVFAYAGHVSFFTFMSEFRDLRDWPKALYVLQGTDTLLYLIVAVVIYRYTGSDVSSPALGSATPTVKKVAYGIAIPTIVIAGVIYGHVAGKYIFVRLFRGTKHLSSRGWFASLTWAGILLICWTIAWIIAESIPVFNDLLALITSLFASWFTYGISGIFWLFLNWGRYKESPKKMLLTGFNFTIAMLGLAICGIGLYATGKTIHEDAGSGPGSWTCADTSSEES